MNAPLASAQSVIIFFSYLAEKMFGASVIGTNIFIYYGPSTKDVRQMGRGGGCLEISDIPGRGRGRGGL